VQTLDKVQTILQAHEDWMSEHKTISMLRDLLKIAPQHDKCHVRIALANLQKRRFAAMRSDDMLPSWDYVA